MIQAFADEAPSPKQRYLYSAAAGGISGGINGALQREFEGFIE